MADLLKGKITDPIELNKRLLHFPGLSYPSSKVSNKNI
jgi:hypothetical protein